MKKAKKSSKKPAIKTQKKMKKAIAGKKAGSAKRVKAVKAKPAKTKPVKPKPSKKVFLVKKQDSLKSKKASLGKKPVKKTPPPRSEKVVKENVKMKSKKEIIEETIISLSEIPGETAITSAKEWTSLAENEDDAIVPDDFKGFDEGFLEGGAEEDEDEF